MKTKTLQHAFPIVAAAIGNRFGIKVSIGGDQAYTDGKAIQLSAYAGDDPAYQEIAWGLLAHEAAHIRYSDFSIAYGPSVLRRRLAGAIEDVRIEHELAKDFPGTRLTLRTVIENMIAKGGFTASTINDHPANILHGYVLKSLRARVLGQAALQPLVEQTEKALKANFPKGAVIRLQGLLSEVPERLRSEQDCLNLTDRILTMIEQEVEQQKQNQQPAPSSTEDNKSDADDEANSEPTEPTEPTDQADNSTDANAADKSGQNEESAASMPESDQPSGAGSGSEGSGLTDEQDALEQDIPDVDTEGKQTEASGTLQSDDGETETPNHSRILETLFNAREGDIDQDVFETIKSALTLAQDSVCEQVMPLGNEPPLDERAGLNLFTKVQSESVKIRAALQGLVQSQSMQRTRHSNRGRVIDGKRLPHWSLGDTQVFLRRSVKSSPNTAIHLLVDKSESMSYSLVDKQGNQLGARLPIALEASLALALALEGLPGVNPGITAFPGGDDESVYRLLEHGQRVRSRAGAFSLSASGSTPMTEAIWFGAASLLRCREPRKVLMVMTDGQPNDTLSTLEILQRCRDSGIETVGIGLGIEVSHLFPMAIVINDFRELRSQLFDLSKTVLLAA